MSQRERYYYATTLCFGTDGEPSYSEVDCEFEYSVAWGAPEQGPTYACGGTPADPDEIADVKLLRVEGRSRPWDMGSGFLTDDAFEAMCIEKIEAEHDQMIGEAADQQHTREWAATEAFWND